MHCTGYPLHCTAYPLRCTRMQCNSMPYWYTQFYYSGTSTLGHLDYRDISLGLGGDSVWASYITYGPLREKLIVNATTKGDWQNLIVL